MVRVNFTLSKNKLNVFLSTLNFIFFFIGFQLVTNIFLPSYSDIEGVSRSVSIPYRAFALGLSLLVIVINIHRIPRLWPLSLKVFLFFWVILILRLCYDDFIRTDISLGDTSLIWLYILGICVPAFLSILVSYNYVDLEKSFLFIIIASGISLLIPIFSNQALYFGAVDLRGRQGGSLATSTIAFGHFGATAVILGIYALLYRKINFIYKFSIMLLILLGFFVILVSGSRGPILALVVVFTFWIFAYIRRPSDAVLSVIFLLISTLIFMDYLLNIMGNISPIMESRLRASIYDGDTSNRSTIYGQAMDIFFNNPILGNQLLIVYSDGRVEYAHNMLVDALMGLGIVGGISMTYFLIQVLKQSYRLIHQRDSHFWLVLLLIQQITSNMLSSAFYYNQLLSVLLVFIFLKYRRFRLS